MFIFFSNQNIGLKILKKTTDNLHLTAEHLFGFEKNDPTNKRLWRPIS